MHDLADPIDTALGIRGLTVPNAPAQTFDLLDDHGLRLHPARVVGGQTACRLRRALESHRDVEPIEDGWRRDPGIDQCGPQTRTAISERGHHGGVGSANHSKVQTDQRRNVGASLRHRSKHLPDSASGLDISDADLQVPFALFAAADEGRVQADCDRSRHSCRLARGRCAKLLADLQGMTA
jgi:hypothetical protein